MSCTLARVNAPANTRVASHASLYKRTPRGYAAHANKISSRVVFGGSRGGASMLSSAARSRVQVAKPGQFPRTGPGAFVYFLLFRHTRCFSAYDISVSVCSCATFGSLLTFGFYNPVILVCPRFHITCMHRWPNTCVRYVLSSFWDQ